MDEKLGILLMLIIVVIAGCAQQAPLPAENESQPDDSVNQTPPGQAGEGVQIREEFENKIVYTVDQDRNESLYREHCEQRGGTFNTCGSICGPDADMCAEVCAWTCELSG